MLDITNTGLGCADAYIAVAARAPQDYRVAAWCAGRRLFERNLRRARVRRLWGLLTRSTRKLFDLNRLGHPIAAEHYRGLQTVPLARIIGGEGRCRDFDDQFNPTQERTIERWLNVYSAAYLGRSLPPVCLIEINGAYFVRDGNHRVSVARALGKLEIEAEVIAWEVRGPLPWEHPAGAGAAPVRLADPLVAG